jgi:hypothetical protein
VPARRAQPPGRTRRKRRTRVRTTFHPDTLEQDVNVLCRIRSELGGRLALNCGVIEPGTISVGDRVELL